jgi:TonB family protein
MPQLTDYILSDYKLPDAPPGSLIEIPAKNELPVPEIDTAAVQGLHGLRPTSPPEYHVSIAHTASSPEIPESLLLPSSSIILAKAATRLPDEERTLEPRLLSEEASRALLIQQELPPYPVQAKAAGLEGSVVLRALVGKDGTIRDVKLIRGHLLLGQAAAEAVKRWRYRPYRVNGQNLEVQTLITLEFRRNS